MLWAFVRDRVNGLLVAFATFPPGALEFLREYRDLPGDAVDDDPRLVDADYGTEVDGAATPAALRRFTERRDQWLEDVPQAASAAGVLYRRVVDDIDPDELLAVVATCGVVS